MDIQLTKKDASKQPPARSRADFFARGGILAAGLICLLLLAWGHLGLGALLFPPAPTQAQQTVVAGPYTRGASVASRPTHGARTKYGCACICKIRQAIRSMAPACA